MISIVNYNINETASISFEILELGQYKSNIICKVLYFLMTC